MLRISPTLSCKSWKLLRDKSNLRYRVSATDFGVDDINNVCERVQSNMLNAFGIAEETRFVQRSAASSD